MALQRKPVTIAAAYVSIALFAYACCIDAHKYHSDAEHDALSPTFEPVITGVSCKPGRDGTEPYTAVVEVTGAKPDKKVAVAFSDALGSSAWGHANCEDSLVSGLSSVDREVWDRADEFGYTKIRFGINSCNAVKYVQALSAPYRKSQCALSPVAAFTDAVGIQLDLLLPLDAPYIDMSDKAAVKNLKKGLVSAFMKYFMFPREDGGPDVIVQVSETPFGGILPPQQMASSRRRLQATIEEIFIRYTIPVEQQDILLKEFRNFAGMFFEGSDSYSKGGGVRNSYKNYLFKEYGIPVSESKALVTKDLDYWRYNVFNPPPTVDPYGCPVDFTYEKPSVAEGVYTIAINANPGTDFHHTQLGDAVVTLGTKIFWTEDRETSNTNNRPPRTLRMADLSTGLNPVAVDVLTGISPSGKNSNEAGNLGVFEGFVYFNYDGGDGAGAEVWRTDGVTTERALDINPGPGNSDPQGFYTVCDRMIIMARTVDGSGFKFEDKMKQMYVFDGTSATMIPGAFTFVEQSDGHMVVPPGFAGNDKHELLLSAAQQEAFGQIGNGDYDYDFEIAMTVTGGDKKSLKVSEVFEIDDTSGGSDDDDYGSVPRLFSMNPSGTMVALTAMDGWTDYLYVFDGTTATQLAVEDGAGVRGSLYSQTQWISDDEMVYTVTGEDADSGNGNAKTEYLMKYTVSTGAYTTLHTFLQCPAGNRMTEPWLSTASGTRKVFYSGLFPDEDCTSHAKACDGDPANVPVGENKGCVMYESDGTVGGERMVPIPAEVSVDGEGFVVNPLRATSLPELNAVAVLSMDHTLSGDARTSSSKDGAFDTNKATQLTVIVGEAA